MKAKLIFNIPEDQDEFDTAVNGHKAYSIIKRIAEECRRIIKNSENETEMETAERILKKIYAEAEENGINI